MVKLFTNCAISLITALCLSAILAQAQSANNNSEQGKESVTDASGLRLFNLLAQSRFASRPSLSLLSRHNASAGPQTFTLAPMAGGPNRPVFGIGDVGRLTKWTEFTNGQSYIGNSTIFEDNDGMVGIGTDSPTSKLTVVGLIETINPGGGIKFPDGTIQTTAGLASVFHDASLTGNGSQSMPLGIAVGGVQTNDLANGAVTGAKGSLSKLKRLEYYQYEKASLRSTATC